MRLRRGRTRSILEGSVDSALLAVEIYNKPRTVFRSEGYITLMVIAWMKLMHAYFNHTIGNKYYYRLNNGRYIKVDGERKSWELKTCLAQYNRLSASNPLSQSALANLQFFIGFRNKIEHRHLAKSELDTLIFGECQSLLFNYENVLVQLFGEDYALQFSHMRTQEQGQANKKILSREVRQIKEYVENYRSSLPSEVFDSQEYSVKLIQIPKISNTNRNDLAIEFVRWSELNEQDKASYEELVTIVKDRVVEKEAVNVGKLKAGAVLDAVEERCGIRINHHEHMCFYYVFSVRPISEEQRDPFDTDTDYCHYDELHSDYVYQESWVNFVIDALEGGQVTLEEIKDCFKSRQKLSRDKLRAMAS